jgi:hypothetical protein
MLSTRIGNGSKMVITGDLQQSDRLSGVNGLNDFLNKYKIWNGQTNSVEIGLIEMTQKDISRSKTVSTILDFYRISTTEEKKPSSDGRVNYKKNSDSALMPMKDIIRSFRTDTYL